MTIATRNRFIRIAALISLVLTIISIISVSMLIFQERLSETEPTVRTLPILSNFYLTPYNSAAAIASIGIFPLFTVIGLLYILFAFEKTQTIEITFFAACVFAVSFESTRLLIPLYQVDIYGNFFSISISRFVFFSRIFTMLTLLASAIFATGNTIQQIGPSIFLLAFFSLSLANSIPLNSETMSSNFLIASGYTKILVFFFALSGFLSALSYLILGKTRNIPEYSRAAGGIVLFLIGYTLLAVCDTWLFFVVGSGLLFWGASLYLKPMHRYYLWQ